MFVFVFVAVENDVSKEGKRSKGLQRKPQRTLFKEEIRIIRLFRKRANKNKNEKLKQIH